MIGSSLSGLRQEEPSPTVWCLFKGKKKRQLQYIYSTEKAAQEALDNYKKKKYFIQEWLLRDLYNPPNYLILDSSVLVANANMEALKCNADNAWKDAINIDNAWLDAEGNLVEPKLLGS